MNCLEGYLEGKKTVTVQLLFVDILSLWELVKLFVASLNLTRSGYLGANAGHICRAINFKQTTHGKYV